MRVTCCTRVLGAPTYDAQQSRIQGQHVAKKPGRRSSARSHSLHKAGRALVVSGLVVIAVALWATTTRLEAASNGLMLIGGPLMLLGGVLMGLDWMASYTPATEGSWDHHVKPGRGSAARGGDTRGGERDTRRRRSRGVRSSEQRRAASEFAASVADFPISVPAPQEQAGLSPSPVKAPPIPAPRPPLAEPTMGPTTVISERGASVRTAVAAAAVVAVAEASPVPAAAVAVTAVPPPAWPQVRPAPDEVRKQGPRSDPGPDTMIEEFVGYEGQDRMLAVHETLPRAPRELAWPNPPRKAVDVSAEGNGAFLEKLMDEVLAKIGTHEDSPAAASPVALKADHHGNTLAPAAAPELTLPALSWSPQTLHRLDHWRFAAMVEKLYQQAGFATQLQAGQMMPGVVVLWLFSRHRPGMPASVVRCVHLPGQALSAAEILAVADLVKARGLPRGQLATTATVDAAGRQLAAAQQVHLMDTQRLLELITRRTVEQQRVLASRLA